MDLILKITYWILSIELNLRCLLKVKEREFFFFFSSKFSKWKFSRLPFERNKRKRNEEKPNRSDNGRKFKWKGPKNWDEWKKQTSLGAPKNDHINLKVYLQWYHWFYRFTWEKFYDISFASLYLFLFTLFVIMWTHHPSQKKNPLTVFPQLTFRPPSLLPPTRGGGISIWKRRRCRFLTHLWC